MVVQKKTTRYLIISICCGFVFMLFSSTPAYSQLRRYRDSTFKKQGAGNPRLFKPHTGNRRIKNPPNNQQATESRIDSLYELNAGAVTGQSAGAYVFSLNILRNTETGEKTYKSVNIGNNSALYTSLQQLVKGSSTGVYIQEPSGEPGVDQNMFIRGVSYPLVNRKELINQQPTVFLNGIPLIQDNPFILDYQVYDINKIGPATNIFNTLNSNMIKSIDVITDPFDLAILGPIAANGAIWVETKHANGAFKKVTVNSYFGAALEERATPVNATYEYRFREPFYKKYASAQDYAAMPRFLKDTLNPDYYGPAQWQDLYYNTGLAYNFDAMFTGGAGKSNYFFFTGVTHTGGNTDNTRLLKFTESIQLNSKIKDWITASGNINFTKITRKRNLNQQDRFAEQRYIPSLENPLAPTIDLYSYYLGEFDKAIDKNNINALQGYVSLNATPLFKNLQIISRVGFDYNDASRSTFWPTTLLEGNNFYSNYFGFNQRLYFTNNISYKFNLQNDKDLKINIGQSMYANQHVYTYFYAYNSVSDFVKSAVGTASNTIPIPYASLIKSNLLSFSSNIDYDITKNISFSGLFRRDGSSEFQPNVKWFNSYGASLNYKVFQNEEGVVNKLEIKASWSRIGKLLNDDKYSKGSQYVASVGWGAEKHLGAYNGISALVRPYSSGRIRYDVSWQYVEASNLALEMSLFKNKADLQIVLYNRENKNMLALIPVPGVQGYNGVVESGVWVNNNGAELTLSAIILNGNNFVWQSQLAVSYNTNKLKGLPRGIKEIVLNSDFKIQVGKRIDAFWILTNEGIYNSVSEIPTSSNGKVLSYRGLPFEIGDAKWTDLNKDNVINDDDRVLKGNYIPKISGGFNNAVGYKNFQVDLQIYFALGRKILNQYARSRLDFINSSNSGDINSVKEITFWEKRMEFNDYPLYNPWSSKLPYQLKQSLFFEDGSFVKLRALSLSYSFQSKKPGVFMNTNAPRNRRIYFIANNLIALSKFRGGDPELTSYDGIFNGNGTALAKSVSVGIEIDL